MKSILTLSILLLLADVSAIRVLTVPAVPVAPCEIDHSGERFDPPYRGILSSDEEP